MVYNVPMYDRVADELLNAVVDQKRLLARGSIQVRIVSCVLR